ncbi:MAG: dihydrolipoamide acetyltransferase family protein, partial [Polyangiaceae bacterium]
GAIMSSAMDVKMPQLGESVSEGTISKWLVKEGDVVTKDQPIVEIGTDKADSELPAPVGGRIGSIAAHEGDVVAVNTVLCTIEEGVTAAAPKTTSHTTPSPAMSVSAPTVAAPSGENPSYSKSATGSALASPTARKTALEHDVNLGNVRGTGDYGRITKEDVLRARSSDAGDDDAAPHTEPPGLVGRGQPSLPPENAQQPKAPTAAAKELSSLLNGFVPPIPGKGYGAFKVPQYRPQPGDQVVPFTRRRRITADHMIYSKFSSPHVVTVAEVDLYKAAKLREEHKERYKKEGLSLTMLAFVSVAVARALRETPTMNARVLDDAYVIFKDINIGIAVDSADGLVVPVVRRADELGVRGIVRGIDDVAKRAKTGKITIDDLSGATFSVTNPGIKGNLFGGAIISQPNVGILRMGEIQKRVVVIEGPNGEDMMAIHPVMFLALSYDHRIVDGVAANAFLWRMTEIIEKAEFEV